MNASLLYTSRGRHRPACARPGAVVEDERHPTRSLLWDLILYLEGWAVAVRSHLCHNKVFRDPILPHHLVMTDTPPPEAGRSPAITSGSPPAPGPPMVDMSASPEMQAWLEQLRLQDRKLGAQNRVLAAVLAVGVVALLGVLWALYSSTIGAYAQIDGVTAEQHPADPGRIVFSFRVTRPGRVVYRRSSGDRVTEMADSFSSTGDLTRPWTWSYTPGDDIVVTTWFRSGLFRRSRTWRFPTSRRIDIVMLVDTSQSTTSRLRDFKKRCARFAERLPSRGWRPRFGLVAFGGRNSEPRVWSRDLSANFLDFMVAMDEMPRFPDGPTQGAALDALEAALSMPFARDTTRWFFLMTDAGYRDPTRGGVTADQVAKKLAEKRVRLDVFSLPEWKSDYEPLLGGAGRFFSLARFGQLLAQEQVLED